MLACLTGVENLPDLIYLSRVGWPTNGNTLVLRFKNIVLFDLIVTDIIMVLVKLLI